MSDKFTHLDAAGNPSMVDVGHKKITRRMARARSIVVLDDQIMDQLENEEIHTKKGPVFQTAIIAGVMGAKRPANSYPYAIHWDWIIARSRSRSMKTERW